MKIREIEAIGLSGATPLGGWTNDLKPTDSVQTLVIVRTDSDVFGVGASYTNVALVRAAIDVMEPLWRGESAIEPERVSEKLRQHTFWMGRGGSLTHAISGIDIALWDILGKVTGTSVGRLLGGRHRDRVTPYASMLMQAPEPLKESLQPVKAAGFRAVKLGWGPFGRVSAAQDEAIVRAARDTLGNKIEVMIDAGGSGAFWPNGYNWAMKTAHMLAHYDVKWFEEPLEPDALDDFVALRRASPVPIAGGEVLTRRQAFQPWLQAGAFDVVQPDVCKVGGISESRRIGWMAEDNGVRMIPHGWNTAIGLAADLQLAATLAQTDRVEYLQGSPYIDEIKPGGWTLDDDGMLVIPDAPGLGIEIDWDAVQRYSDTPFAQGDTLAR